MLYYIKNISNIKAEGTSFLLNDNDYKKINFLSKKLYPSDILLIWEFTIKTIKEVNVVSSPNLAIEMFLIQIMYLINKNFEKNEKINNEITNVNEKEIKTLNKTETVNQIKNIKQEEEIGEKNNLKLEKFSDLINICLEKKEMQLKYELENNVNLVSFSNNRIEISFNDKLNKDFVKELTDKLFLWTNTRWVISFSKQKGEISKKQEIKNLKEKKIHDFKYSTQYKELLKFLPDIELIDFKNKND